MLLFYILIKFKILYIFPIILTLKMLEINNYEENINKKEEEDNDEEEEFSDMNPGEDFSSPEGATPEFSEIRCPLCPKFAKIKINYLDNEIISECPDKHFMKLDILSFIEKSTDHPLSSTKCSICNSTFQTESYCFECNKYYCNECLEKHNENNFPSNNIGMHTSILLKNNTFKNNISNLSFENNINNINNTSFPKHINTLNIANNRLSSINSTQHHIINIKDIDNNCAIHNEKFNSFCLKCNKSFCEKCLDEIKRKSTNNLNAISCLKLGNFSHNIKFIKDMIGEEKLNKFKQNLEKEEEILNYLENQSNLLIEQMFQKLNNVKETHLLKGELYDLYLKNQENGSLVKTMSDLENNGFNLNPEQFNTSEKLLKNLEIINIKFPKEDKDNNILNSNNNILNSNIFENNIINVSNITEEEKQKEITQSKLEKKLELKRLKEEKKKEVKRLKEEKKEEVRKKKEELKKIKEEKKKEKQRLKEEKKKEKQRLKEEKKKEKNK